ncbi:capsule biosynthesis protein [Roseinatronobacter alkalisoli]|uniref:Capsule biosynthesis protein n=1 Tax=Roseinatronobacter alkalisoli TaxID=3028235 RepID=A0ABT5T466_9RHOB|nr:capsule biosynthesis protein [Roseinatronobacter sp. HJB301]MDD7969910.1 capsule biosynthesis protein [Roseinatronobacter sp. HJB301]
MTTPVKSQRFRLRKTAQRATLSAVAGEDSTTPPQLQMAQSATQPVAAISVHKRPRAAVPAQRDTEPAPDLRESPPGDGMAEPASAQESPPPTPAPASPGTGTEPTPPIPQPVADVHSADVEGPASVAQSLDSIRAEGLTARQLRMAMRVAQKHGIRATSSYEAVLILRQRGIDPFARATMLELLEDGVKPSPSRELALRGETAPATVDDPLNAAQARMARIAADRERDLAKVRRDIAKRRRKRMLLLGARLLAFVTLPTFIVTWYFYVLATPMYATESEFVIQQADSQSGMGALSGVLPSAAGMGMGGQNEATSVQSFLQSRGAMLRLDAEEGFKDHFRAPEIDLLRRLAEGATDEAAYKLYQRQVRIGYDPTEGVVRMEVIAASPEDSERFARALISYAEEHVDMMTQRLRDSQMREARASLEEAQIKLVEARQAAIELQEQSSIISGEVELSLLSQRIVALETELTQTRLSLQEMRSNARPSAARLQALERREEALRAEIEILRNSMTQGDSEGSSLARIQSGLIMAEAEVQTREMMRAQAMQQLESARMEVSRQVRYLALSVEPIAPDEATYPRKLENSIVAFLIFLGIYLLLSMTASVLREQVSG